MNLVYEEFDTAMLTLRLHEVAAEYAPDSVPHNSHAAHVEVCHLEKALRDLFN